MKIVKIDDEEHKEAKKKAKTIGMTLKGYLNHLIREDTKMRKTGLKEAKKILKEIEGDK